MVLPSDLYIGNRDAEVASESFQKLGRQLEDDSKGV